MYDLITPFFLGIGLAADAFAVSLTSGLAIQRLKLNKILKIALFFGSFQAIMPLIGWLLGYSFRGIIADVDHWIAFFLLLAIGGKMIREAFSTEEEDKKFNPLDTYTLLTLSIATSIDALAAGISLAFLKTPVLMAASIIGTITFILSALGVAIGHRFGNLFRDKVELFGGVVLIGIGFKILIEHLTAA